MKFGIKIRLTAVLSFVSIFSMLAKTDDTKISINAENVSVAEAIEEAEATTVYRLVYSTKSIDLRRKLSINSEEDNMENFLNDLFSNTGTSNKIRNTQIVLNREKNTKRYHDLELTTITAQQLDIKGTILDTNGQPLAGANVIEKDTNNGSQSDFDGNFSITVSNPNATLVISYVGFVTQEISVNNETMVTVTLMEDAATLDEVVVVGYGTMRKSDLTGAISQVKGEVLNTISSSNPVEALQGRASGVAIVNSDASPGSSPAIRIRGSGSISASNEPLIVVDGFPLSNNNLNDISSNDIESMEVLKDASSAAIYGSRGANGVILITTKKGKKGQNNFEISASSGIATATRLPKMLGRTDFLNFINDAYTYSNGNPVYSASNPAPETNTNWQKEINRNLAKTQNYSIGFNGGKDKTTYMLSGNLFSQEGMVEGAGFKKLTVRTNLNHEFKPWLTIGTHLQVGRSKRNVRDNPTGNTFRYGWPTIPVKNPDGSWHYATEDPSVSSYFEGTWNPVSEASEVTNELSTDRILGDVYAIFTPLKNLTFKTNYGVDVSNEKQYEYYSSKSTTGIGTGGTGVGGQAYQRQTSQLTDNILTYANVWNKHRLSVTGVYSWQEYLFENLAVSGSGFQNDATGANDISYAPRESIGTNSDKYSNRLISWTARGSYSYADKYLLTVTGRYDGSSRFGENNKWGFFPSVGLAWRVDQESFMRNNEVISNLKLRTSYGVTGNQEIGNYQSLSVLESAYYVYNDMPILGFTETIGNPDLKWERNIQYNIGVDVSLWNKLDLSVDYYTRRTSDLLYDVPIPTTSGYSSMLQNIGEVKNSGLEFTAHARILDSDFKWDLSANFSTNDNKIVELYGGVDKINLGTSSAGIARYLIVGEPVNSVWGRESAGIIQTQEQLTSYQTIRPSAKLGEEMYVDHNKDNTINSSDYVNIGSTSPDFFYGISTNLSYKKLSLDIYGQGATGLASNADENYMIFGENQIQNRNYLPTQYAYQRMWSPTNPNGTFPRAGAQEVYLSNRTNGDLKYFIVKNIKLGYDFSSIIEKYNSIKELNVFITAQNFINTANHRGYNPENANVTFPYSKTMTIGIRAKF